MLWSFRPRLFNRHWARLLLAPALVVTFSGCKRETANEAPPPRPVRTVIVEKGGLGETVVLTGQISGGKGSRARLSYRRSNR